MPEKSEIVGPHIRPKKFNNKIKPKNIHGNLNKSKLNTSNNIVRFKTSFRNTIYDVMIRRGWKECDEDWDFYWADRDYVYGLLDTAHLQTGQKMNHFRNGRELCRKDGLIKNLKKMRRQLEKEGKTEEYEAYGFFPTSFILPADYSLFVEEFKKNQGIWIMKPAARSQGKGIFLFTKLSQVSDWKLDPGSGKNEVENYVVQKYICNPYLVGGRKFDLRIYALVPTFSPLQIYLYRAGFARFTNTRYSNDPHDIANSFIHLTNVAIQKTSENYNKKHGGKWDLRKLKLYLMWKNPVTVVDKLFHNMQMIIIYSLLSVQKIMMNDKHCFELYGYDMMIDTDLKPWLIEVNASPSLSANTAQDYQLKCKMLNEMLDIIDMEKKNKDKPTPKRVGGFDLVYTDGEICSPPEGIYSSFLGAELSDPKST